MGFYVFAQIGIPIDNRKKLPVHLQKLYEELVGDGDTPHGAYIRIGASQHPNEVFTPYMRAFREAGYPLTIGIFESAGDAEEIGYAEEIGCAPVDDSE